MDFEFMSTDDMIFIKSSRFGNKGFYFKGFDYTPPKESVYERKPIHMNVQTVFGGSYVVGCNYMFGYGQKKNIPKNVQ